VREGREVDGLALLEAGLEKAVNAVDAHFCHGVVRVIAWRETV
jgi:hypothetical protein